LAEELLLPPSFRGAFNGRVTLLALIVRRFITVPAATTTIRGQWSDRWFHRACCPVHWAEDISFTDTEAANVRFRSYHVSNQSFDAVHHRSL